MVTRLYLQSSGVPAISDLAVSSIWGVNDVIRLPTATQKSGTALTTRTLPWAGTATANWCWWQFQSPAFTNNILLTTAHTLSLVIGKCAETTGSADTKLSASIRVVDTAGATRGTLYETISIGSEFDLMASASTRIISVTALIANVSCSVGDRLIIELGVTGITPVVEDIQMRIGDPIDIADFALTGVTTDLVSWLELSADIEFDEMFFPFHYVNSVDNGTSFIVRPLQSSGNVTMTVAAGQIIPIYGKRKTCTATVIGLLP